MSENYVLKKLVLNYDTRVDSEGRGAFLIYPQTTSSLKIVHMAYTLATNSRMRVVDRGYLSQDISTRYDKVKHLSSEFKFASGTIPAGVFALSGTYAATVLFNPYIDLPSVGGSSVLGEVLSIGNVPALTADNYNKIVGFKSTDSLIINTISESVDQPALRSNDSSPTTLVYPNGLFDADVSNVARYMDNQKDITLRQQIRTAAYGGTFTNAGNFEIATGTVNVPCPNGRMDVTVDFAPFSGFIDVPTVTSFVIQLTLVVFDEARNEMGSYTKNHVQQFDNNVGGEVFLPGNSTNQNFIVDTRDFGDNLVKGISQVAYKLKFTFILAGGGAVTVANAAWQINSKIDCINAGFIGESYPVVILAYDNFTEDSQILVSGIQNLQLKPNSDLAQDIPTNPSSIDVDAYEQWSRIYSKAYELGFRGLYNETAYREWQKEMFHFINAHDSDHDFSNNDLINIEDMYDDVGEGSNKFTRFIGKLGHKVFDGSSKALMNVGKVLAKQGENIVMNGGKDAVDSLLHTVKGMVHDTVTNPAMVPLLIGMAAGGFGAGGFGASKPLMLQKWLWRNVAEKPVNTVTKMMAKHPDMVKHATKFAHVASPQIKKMLRDKEYYDSVVGNIPKAILDGANEVAQRSRNKSMHAQNGNTTLDEEIFFDCTKVLGVLAPYVVFAANGESIDKAGLVWITSDQKYYDLHTGTGPSKGVDTQDGRRLSYWSVVKHAKDSDIFFIKDNLRRLSGPSFGLAIAILNRIGMTKATPYLVFTGVMKGSKVEPMPRSIVEAKMVAAVGYHMKLAGNCRSVTSDNFVQIDNANRCELNLIWTHNKVTCDDFSDKSIGHAADSQHDFLYENELKSVEVARKRDPRYDSDTAALKKLSVTCVNIEKNIRNLEKSFIENHKALVAEMRTASNSRSTSQKPARVTTQRPVPKSKTPPKQEFKPKEVLPRFEFATGDLTKLPLADVPKIEKWLKSTKTVVTPERKKEIEDFLASRLKE
jgi:hypothetical protein